jgi:hypothetical protein
MADVTVSNSPALVGTTRNVESNHEGTVTVPFNWTANGHTISTSSIVWLAKIPHGAHIVDLKASGWIGCAGDATIDVGLVGETSLDYLVDGATTSATATANFTVRTGALPHFVSLSDDTQPRFRYLQAKYVTVATATTTAIIRGSISYVMGKPTIGN